MSATPLRCRGVRILRPPPDEECPFSAEKEMVFFCGIIDCLTPYDVSKQARPETDCSVVQAHTLAIGDLISEHAADCRRRTSSKPLRFRRGKSRLSHRPYMRAGEAQRVVSARLAHVIALVRWQDGCFDKPHFPRIPPGTLCIALLSTSFVRPYARLLVRSRSWPPCPSFPTVLPTNWRRPPQVQTHE